MKRKVIAMPTEVYSRVVGYYRPVQNWNDGKKKEFASRYFIGTGSTSSTKERKER